MNKFPYTLMLAAAIALDDMDRADEVIKGAVGGMVDDAIALARKYHSDDLPLVVASLRVVASALESIMPDDQKMLMDIVMRETTVTVINVKELRKQCAGESNENEEK